MDQGALSEGAKQLVCDEFDTPKPGVERLVPGILLSVVHHLLEKLKLATCSALIVMGGEDGVGGVGVGCSEDSAVILLVDGGLDEALGLGGTAIVSVEDFLLLNGGIGAEDRRIGRLGDVVVEAADVGECLQLIGPRNPVALGEDDAVGAAGSKGECRIRHEDDEDKGKKRMMDKD